MGSTRPARGRLLALLVVLLAACERSDAPSGARASGPTLVTLASRSLASYLAGLGAAVDRLTGTARASEARPAGTAPPEDPAGSAVADDERVVDLVTLGEQRQRLYAVMARELGLSEAQIAEVERIFEASPYLGQGNPELTQHPFGPDECWRRRAEAGVVDQDDARCGAPHMVPLYNRGAGETARQARVCIDRYEFPDVACEYPVTYARSSEAAQLCRAVGKRLCDAHEWEGACAGSLLPFEDDYRFDLDRLQGTDRHNKAREVVWAYGPVRDRHACGTSGERSPGCTGEWTKCGSNTYPAGSFPRCRSPFGVDDLHGNAAEHMSLPLLPEGERAADGDHGWTEMKGSWFGFSGALPHEDDCRWRAPDWHATRIDNPGSHRNYHLGFRCCADIPAPDDG